MADQVKAEAISLVVNGVERRMAAGRTIADLLDELGLHAGLVVVEHNREILDRRRYGETELRSGDVLELVHFVGGG